jgi:hypothetical protein
MMRLDRFMPKPDRDGVEWRSRPSSQSRQPQRWLTSPR